MGGGAVAAVIGDNAFLLQVCLGVEELEGYAERAYLSSPFRYSKLYDRPHRQTT